MRVRNAALPVTFVFVILGPALLPFPARAASITFSGTISYQGSYSGDTLYVAALDTAGVEDVTLLDLKALTPGPPPFNQPYSLSFDNTGVSPTLLVAAFLDTDGGGVDSVGGADVFGWYAGDATPAGISSASSHSGLDFALPRAEIHGTITFAVGQTEARVDVSGDPACALEGFRPGHYAYSPGPYSILGVYPGTYCVSAQGPTMSGSLKVCYGGCASPTLITLTATEVRNGVDLNFQAAAPVERSTWGRIKARYP
jgi:hypothetical protein